MTTESTPVSFRAPNPGASGRAMTTSDLLVGSRVASELHQTRMALTKKEGQRVNAL